jgi:hypothetical protein
MRILWVAQDLNDIPVAFFVAQILSKGTPAVKLTDSGGRQVTRPEISSSHPESGHVCFNKAGTYDPAMAMDEDNKPRPRCNCKISQCIQRYCQCFGNRWFCFDACRCESCYYNTEARAAFM